MLAGARARRDGVPFAMAVAFFVAAFLTLGVMFWPYMIPYALTVADAAAPDVSLRFFFYGGIVVLPVIAAYTIGVYWVFRGKIDRLDPPLLPRERREVWTMKLCTTPEILVTVASLLCTCGLAFAEDAIRAPAQKTIGMARTEIVPSLIVMNSDGARLNGNTLTLTGISTNAIMFADRPLRSAGHALTAHLLEEWAPGSGNFAGDPPNATVSVLNKDASAVEDAVVVLKRSETQR